MKGTLLVILLLLMVLPLVFKVIETRNADTEHDSIPEIVIDSIPRLPSQIMSATNPDIEMTIENLDSLRIPVDSIVVKFTNHTDECIMYGTRFWVYREENGKWKEVRRNPSDTSEVNVVFVSIGYMVPPDSSSIYVNPTKFINKAFTPGKYRLVKTVFVGDSHQSDTLSVTFSMP